MKRSEGGCEGVEPVKGKEERGRRFSDRRGGGYFHLVVGDGLMKAGGLRDEQR